MTELFQRGYDRNLAMGSLAGAGNAGFPDSPVDHHDHLWGAG